MKYEEPEMEVLEFYEGSIITTSSELLPTEGEGSDDIFDFNKI